MRKGNTSYATPLGFSSPNVLSLRDECYRGWRSSPRTSYSPSSTSSTQNMYTMPPEFCDSLDKPKREWRPIKNALCTMSKARKVLYLPQTQEAKTFQKGKAERHVQNMQQLSQSGHGARTPETCADVQLPGDSDGEASAPAECGYVIISIVMRCLDVFNWFILAIHISIMRIVTVITWPTSMSWG